MKLSQFYNLFKTQVPDSKIIPGTDCEIYSFKPVNVIDEYEDGLLYVSLMSYSGLSPDKLLRSGYCHLVSGDEKDFETLQSAEKNPETNIVFVSGYTLVQLFNIISEVFLRENRFTAQLNELHELANSGAGLQALTDKAQSILNCPVVVMDNSYRIMAISLGALAEDQHKLLSQQQMGNITEENLNRMKRDRVYEKIRQAPGRMTYEKAHDSDTWWVNMLITVHGIEVAEVGIEEVGRKLDDYDFRLIRFLQKMIAIEMQRNSYLHSDFGASHAILLRELIERRLVSEEIVARRARLLGWKDHPYYFLLTVYSGSRSESVSQRTYDIFVRRLLPLFPNCRWRVTDENLVLLIPRPNNSFVFFREQNSLKDLLRINNFIAILSNPITSLMDVQKAYNQTTAIYGLRSVVKDSCNLWFYIDYTLLHMADLLRASHDLEDFVHPYILDIYRYDRENETDYLPTLKEYLTNINNPGQCAANLHIHKNTLYYRINKISDVFGLDLSNGELRMRLQLSLELLKLNSFETGQ